jgi:hypothetical protein
MRRFSAFALPLLILLAACGGSEPEAGAPAEAPQRVESPALGLAVAALPGSLAVAVNQGQELLLEPADERPGALRFELAAPPRGGVNLVQAVNDHKAAVEARREGDYRGQVELMSPLGTAYASRGRYTGEDGETVEELAIFTLHPTGDRLLSLIYTYPAVGDTEERRDELIGVLAEIEGTGTPPEAAAEEPAPDQG